MDHEIRQEFDRIWEEINKLKKNKSNESELSNGQSARAENLEPKINKLCEDAKIERSDFDSLFFIKEKELLLIIVPEGKNEEERQLHVTLCILTAQNCLFNEDFIKSSDLNAKLKKLEVKSLVNLSTNLKKHKQLLIPEGKPKSRNFGFRITIPGKKRGLELLKTLLNKK